MRSALVGICILISILQVDAGEIKSLEWLKTFGGDSFDLNNSVTCDNVGNIYFAGSYESDSVDFGNILVFNNKDSTQNTLIISKLNPNGVCQWIRPIRGYYKEIEITNSLLDYEGNILFVGQTRGVAKRISFGNGIVVSGDNFNNIFFVKYSPDGNCLWAHCISGDTIGSIKGSQGMDICLDSDNNIYISGYCNNIDFGNGVKLNNNNGQMPFFAKYNSNGYCQWAKRLIQKDITDIWGADCIIRWSPNNTLTIAGYMFDPTDFGDGKFVDKSVNTPNSRNIFVANYTIDGLLKWVKIFAGQSDYIFNDLITLTDIAFDSYSNFYITGYFFKDGNFAPGFQLKKIMDTTQSDIYIAKCDSDGDVQWVKTFGGNGDDCLTSFYLKDNNNLLACGWTYSSRLNFGNEILNNSHKNIIQGFLVLFDSNGTAKGSNSISYQDSGSYIVPTKITEDKNQDIIVTGNFRLAIELNKKIIKSNGFYDIFLAKYSKRCDYTSFTLPNFSVISSLNFVKSAEKVYSVLRLTPAKANQSGAVWSKNLINVSNGFTAKFKFRMSSPYNDFDDGSLPGADGIAFVIQNAYPLSYGNSGGGLGYEGISNSLAIEFDTYKNEDKPYFDLDGNHVAVFSNGIKANTCNHNSKANLKTTNDIIQIRADSTIYHVQIKYSINPSKLIVFLDSTGKFEKPILEIDSIDISKLLSLNNGTSAFVGFTSSTGTSYENNDILDWEICSDLTFSYSPVEEDAVEYNQSDFSISPNPATDFIEIFVGANGRSLLLSDVKILNIFGQTVLSVGVQNLEPLRLVVSSLPSGMYFVRFGDSVGKFVKL